MTFLVTGATGFIGRRLVRRLLQTYPATSITCLVKSAATPLEANSLETFHDAGVRLVEGDLVGQPIRGRPSHAFDVVFHLAANIDTAAAEEDLRVNHEGTVHLLDWIRPVAREARVLYTSSVAVHDRDAPPRGPIVEQSPFVARTLYGRTKLEGERIIRERAPADGYEWTILRLPTVYGPGQKPHGLFDKMITMARRGSLAGRIDWPGKTSIIHVDDAADVMLDLAMRDETRGEVYCVASDESLTVGEISRAAGVAVGRPVKPIVIPAPLVAILQALAFNRTVAAALPRAAGLSFWRLGLIVADGFWFDTTKFRSVYRKPLKTIDDGLRETLG